MKRFLLISLLALSFLPFLANAYTGEFSVNTYQERVNAIEATIHIPVGIQIKEILIGESAVLLWVKQPTLDEGAGTISFSGVTPGGFQGKQKLFSFSMVGAENGLLKVSYSEVRALRSDGSGIGVAVAFSFQSKEIEEDLLPPEPFLPVISHSPELYQDRSFVSFLTQDKNSGIDHYEYASTWLLPPSESAWQRATSPLLLSQTDFFKKIYIRAVDKTGHARRAQVSGPYHYASLGFGIILILCVLAFTQGFFL